MITYLEEVGSKMDFEIETDRVSTAHPWLSWNSLTRLVSNSRELCVMCASIKGMPSGLACFLRVCA